MSIIVNVRGTNGSGKTTVAKALMEDTEVIPIFDDRGKPQDYLLPEQNLIILGKYETACGGCDTIKTMNEIEARLYAYSQEHNVFFEGLLISNKFQRWVNVYNFMTAVGDEMHICFLDTPQQTCIDRVVKRRLEKGNTKEFNPKALMSYHKSGLRCQQRMRDETEVSVLELDHTSAVIPVKELLQWQY